MLNHHLISLLLLLLYGLLVSPSSSSSSSVEKGWINNLFDLSEDEKLAISLGANSLSNYAGKHRPSCFQQAAQSLRIGCNARHISDGVKVFFAIKLTHCEIATASYATPRECQEMEQQQHQWGSSEDFEDEFNAPSSPYTASDLMEDGDPGGGSGWFIGSLKKGKKQKQQHQRSSHFHSYIDSIQGEALKCVEAFSRVPQLWTSYSGYFKEVVNMCFSVRYEIERTQLSDLYRNLTLSQLSSYRLMRDQNEEFKLWRLESLDELKQLNDLQQQNIVLSEQIEVK